MAASLKQTKQRIRSIQNTVKITRAMEMVSISKLRRIEVALAGVRNFFQKHDAILKHLAASGDPLEHPFFRGTAGAGNVLLCVVTSDTGLCGSYNNAVLKLADTFIAEAGADNMRLVPVGKRGFSYLKKRGFDTPYIFVGNNGRYSAAVADQVAGRICAMFLSGEISRAFVAHTHFESLARYRPVIEQLLPVVVKPGKVIDVIIEPGIQQVSGELAPRYLSAKMRLMMVESFIAEHASRMIAMRMATDNAQELKDALVIARNKARQASITKDVIEIISSYGVLKE